jgi:uncharacterized protein YlbG (UPF0298 family)
MAIFFGFQLVYCIGYRSQRVRLVTMCNLKGIEMKSEKLTKASVIAAIKESLYKQICDNISYRDEKFRPAIREANAILNEWRRMSPKKAIGEAQSCFGYTKTSNGIAY